MEKLTKGMVIKSSYDNWTYRIQSVVRGCTCPAYLDEIDMDDPPPRAPHIHVKCTDMNDKGEYWFNWYDEETLRSIDTSWCGMKRFLGYDYIVILPNDKPIQMELF